MQTIQNKKGITTKILSPWETEDVLGQARNRGIKLTAKEAGDVLDYCANEHDACIGINWDVIDHWIDEVLSERNAK